MIGRTLGQFALPTTFANVTGRWRRGLVEAAGALRTLAAELPVQLGGPVGDESSYGPHGAEIAAGVAERLGLAVRRRTLVDGAHTDRPRSPAPGASSARSSATSPPSSSP